MELSQIIKNGEEIHPGSALDDVDSPTNICFINCHELGFPGSAFFRTDPKKIIYLCSEVFDYPLKVGNWREMENIVTHELIHWIDASRGFNLEKHRELFCSEMRAGNDLLLTEQTVHNQGVTPFYHLSICSPTPHGAQSPNPA